MHVPLAANRFIAQLAFFISHHTEQQHPLPQRLSMFISPNIHGNAIDRIGAIARRRQQAITNGIQAAQLRRRPEDIPAVLKCQWSGAKLHCELGIERHRRGLKNRRSRRNHDRASMAMKNARAKALGFDGCVVMTGIARPARPEEQGFMAGIDHAMRIAAGNVVQTAGNHRFGSGRAVFIHEHQHTLAADDAVVFAAIALQMVMPVSHEVFIAHAPRCNGRRAPEETAFRTARNWFGPLNAVNDHVFIHRAQCVCVMKESGHFAQSLFTLLNGNATHAAGQPVDLNVLGNEFCLSAHYRPQIAWPGNGEIRKDFPSPAKAAIIHFILPSLCSSEQRNSVVCKRGN